MISIYSLHMITDSVSPIQVDPIPPFNYEKELVSFESDTENIDEVFSLLLI